MRSVSSPSLIYQTRLAYCSSLARFSSRRTLSSEGSTIANMRVWSIPPKVILLVISPYLLTVIGTRVARALEGLMGMILVILATQMLLNGIRNFIESI